MFLVFGIESITTEMSKNVKLFYDEFKGAHFGPFKSFRTFQEG